MSFQKIQKGNGIFFRSSLLSVPHGFSTRLGGVSVLPHLASMNLGENRGDDAETVRKNRSLFLAMADLPSRTVSAAQIHSTTVFTADEVFLAAFDKKAKEGISPEGDGFVTRKRGITLCVKIADCLPLLLCDAEAGVIGALHAGWRGSARGIAAEGISKMQALGAEPKRIVCAIGPSIHPCCFEVKEDFIEEFSDLLGRETAKRYLLRKENGTVFADLQTLNRDILLAGGLCPENIDIAPHCTCCGKDDRTAPHPDLFFSHRASRGLRGTMAAMIALPEP